MPANKAYIKSISGLIKLAIIIDLIITLICACIGCYSYRVFFLIVSLIGIILEAFFYCSYVFNLTTKINLNWPLGDFLTSAVFAALSFINFCVACAFASYSRYNTQDGAAAFFWLVALILFAVDCFYCYKAWKDGTRPAAAGHTAPYPQDTHHYPTEPAVGSFEYANAN